MYIPENIVDGDDVLLLLILAVTYDGGTSLDPHIATVFVHQSVVICQHLTFVQYYKIYTQNGKDHTETPT